MLTGLRIEPETLDTAVAGWCQRPASLAPVTQAATKKALRRLLIHDLPDVEDPIRRRYGSEDFRQGVNAFAQKRIPVHGLAGFRPLANARVAVFEH